MMHNSAVHAYEDHKHEFRIGGRNKNRFCGICGRLGMLPGIGALCSCKHYWNHGNFGQKDVQREVNPVSPPIVRTGATSFRLATSFRYQHGPENIGN